MPFMPWKSCGKFFGFLFVIVHLNSVLSKAGAFFSPSSSSAAASGSSPPSSSSPVGALAVTTASTFSNSSY